MVGAWGLEAEKFSGGGFFNDRREFVSLSASGNDAQQALQTE